jgi:His/Glu/Gln/Arg/opine family amino acid ABC transporter permease subunit
VLDVLVEYHALLLKGFSTTVVLLVLIMAIGVPVGAFLGVLGARYSRMVGRVIGGMRFFTKVVPVLVLLFWFHYPLQALFKVVIDPFWTTVFTLSFVNSVVVAQIIQSDLELLPRSYGEVASTLGMTKREIVRHIELPIIARRTLPNLLLAQASILEYTLLASLISVQELFRVAQSINSMIYDPIAVYSLLVLFFLIILAPLHLFISYLKRKYTIQYV